MKKNRLLAFTVLAAGVIGIVYSWPVFLLTIFLILATVLAWLYLPFILTFLPAFIPYFPAINPTADIDLASGRLAIVFLAVVGGIYIVYTKKSWFSLSNPTLLLLFFLIWTLLSGLVAEDLGRFIRKYLVFLTIFLLYFLLLAYLQKVRQWEKLFAYWSWSAFLVSLVGLGQSLIQFVIGREAFMAYWGKYVAPILYGANAGEAVASNPSWLVGIGGIDILRALSVFPDPHMLAFYLGMSLPIQIAYILRKTEYCRPERSGAESNGSMIEADPSARRNDPLRITGGFLWIMPTLSLLVLLLTFSRGSYVGLVGVAGWALFYLLKKGIHNVFIYRSILILAVIILVVFSVAPIRDRFTSILDFNEGSNKGRLEIWSEAGEVIKYNPLLGVGLGNYSNFVRPEADYREPIYAHNSYLDLASETGLPGVIAWALILLWAMSPLFSVETQNFACPAGRRASLHGGNKHLYDYNLAAALGIFWFSLHSLFETPIFSPQILPLILVLLAFRTCFEDTRYRRQDTKQ